MKVKKVWKYGTGDIIPEGAIYLSTQVETFTKHDINIYGSNSPKGDLTQNFLVWHYFLVEVEEEP